MWLQFFALDQKCKTKLLVKHMKIHQDDKARCEPLDFQRRKNAECDESAKIEEREKTVGSGRIQTYNKRVKVMMWTQKGVMKENPYN